MSGSRSNLKSSQTHSIHAGSPQKSVVLKYSLNEVCIYLLIKKCRTLEVYNFFYTNGKRSSFSHSLTALLLPFLLTSTGRVGHVETFKPFSSPHFNHLSLLRVKKGAASGHTPSGRDVNNGNKSSWSLENANQFKYFLRLRPISSA